MENAEKYKSPFEKLDDIIAELVKRDGMPYLKSGDRIESSVSYPDDLHLFLTYESDTQRGYIE